MGGQFASKTQEACMKSGVINIDRYTGVEPEQKFNFLYENFFYLTGITG